MIKIFGSLRSPSSLCLNLTLDQKFKLFIGESNVINGEKIVSGFTAEKKCLLLILSEKNCTFKLGVKKKFDHEGKTIAPHVSNGTPIIDR